MSSLYQTMSYWDLAFAASLILLNGVISFYLRLGLGKILIIASVRVIVQLFLIGLILKWVFATPHWYVVLGIISISTVIAAQAAKGRSHFVYKGMWSDALISILVAVWSVTFFGLTVVFKVDPWYTPQYAIPVAGMVLGNALTAMSLAFDRLISELRSRREQIEMLISLGAGAWEAFAPSARSAAMAGMMPSLNSMMVVGLVSLPGMMTGQILAGQDPQQAIRYQLAIMFFMAAASCLSCVLLLFFVFRRVFNEYGQYMPWLFQAKK